MENWPKPREIVRKGSFPYIFKIEEDFTYQTPWNLKQPFVSEWLEISIDGLIRVKANVTGYRLQVTGYRLQVTGYRLQVTVGMAVHPNIAF